MCASAALLLGCLLTASVVASTDTTFGSGVTLESTTPIADVIARPAEFAGQTVRVEGVVTAVCQHMGCWMTLAPAGTTGETPATLRLKADDGVIVFPISARGKTALAQGVVERVGGGAEAAEVASNAGAATYHLKVTGARLR